MTQEPLALSFFKMHGIGNDFVVMDGRRRPIELDTLQIQWIADRHFGIGCDQLVILRSSEAADIDVQIFNADGSPASFCGNAARCIAWLLHHENNQLDWTLKFGDYLVPVSIDNMQVRVSMPPPRWDWRAIPLDQERAIKPLVIPGLGGLSGMVSDEAYVVALPNPHAVIRVEDVVAVRLLELARHVEATGYFPLGVNLEVVQVMGPSALKMRVFERGVGETNGCGSGACASVVAAQEAGWLTESSEVIVEQRGGVLIVGWTPGLHPELWMKGSVALPFYGTVYCPPSLSKEGA
jgi:diaminopimelate epimerase